MQRVIGGFEMRGQIIGGCALLFAGAALAKGVSEPYATVDRWEIETKDQNCVMRRSYPATAKDGEEGLIVLYDAQREVVALGWVARKPTLPPLRDSLDFDLDFLKGSSLNEKWGSQSFKIEKTGDAYTYMHVFMGSTESDRFLRDLASHDAIALFFGPSLMTSLPLRSPDAVAKLRQCAAKIAERDTSDVLQK